MKVIRTGLDRDPDLRRRFVAEAHRAAAISHPNVIPIFDAGQEDGILFITMPLIRGTDLGRSLANPYGIEPAYAVAALHRVAAALDAAHREGLVHRDVKPSNVLIPHLTPHHPYLTDFGVAASQGMDSASRAGTAAYMAPEQFDGHAVDSTADVYGLAALVFECLTGARAFPTDGAAAERAHTAPARPSAVALREDLPPDIDSVIARGLAVDPHERYAHATDLTRAAAEVLGVEVIDDVGEDELDSRRRSQVLSDQPADTIS